MLKRIVLNGVIAVIVLSLCSFGMAFASWEMGSNVTRLNLSEAPIDIAEDPDGRFLFILTAKEIQVYEIESGKITSRLPIKGAYDRIHYSAKNTSLVLTSNSGLELQIVPFQQVHTFDNSGLAIIGSKTATVTIAVFSDYQ